MPPREWADGQMHEKVAGKWQVVGERNKSEKNFYNPIGNHATYSFVPVNNTNQDFSNFQEIVKSEYGFRTVNPRIKELDFSMITEFLDGFHILKKEYPELKTVILSVLEDGVAGYGQGIVSVNPFDFSNKEATDKFLKTTNGFVKNLNLKAIGVHEAAHALQNIISNSIGKNMEKISCEIVNKAYENIKNTDFAKNKKEEDLRLSISNVAMQNYKETISEAFSNEFLKNDNLFSKEIVNVTKALYNECKR